MTYATHPPTTARQQFGALQHRTFPVYFNVSIGLAGALIALWHRGHPAVLANISNPRIAEVAQVYALGSIVATQGINKLVVGPLTSKYVSACGNWRLVGNAQLDVCC